MEPGVSEVDSSGDRVPAAETVVVVRAVSGRTPASLLGDGRHCPASRSCIESRDTPGAGDGAQTQCDYRHGCDLRMEQQFSRTRN